MSVPLLIVGNVRVYDDPTPEVPWIEPRRCLHVVYVEIDGEDAGLHLSEGVSAAYGFVRFIELLLRV